MSIALDLGTASMRSLRCHERQLVTRRCPARYAACPDDPGRRRLLDRAGIPCSLSDGHLIVAGEAAAEFAQLCQTPLVSLWRDGGLPQNDPPARQLIANIVETLLPGPLDAGETCVFTVPGGSEEESPAAHFVSQIVRLKGYEPICCGGGAALALAELSTARCTGLSLTCGAGITEISIWWMGQELAACFVPRGGDWIDEQLARRLDLNVWDSTGNVYLNSTAAEARKLAAADPSSSAADAVEVRHIVGELYSELLDGLFAEAAETWRRHPRLAKPLAPMPLVCGGGSARWPGFAQLAQSRWLAVASSLPLTIQDVRLADVSEWTIARGCLIAAELEGTAAQFARATRSSVRAA